MTFARSRTLFYYLRRLVTLGGTATYILLQTGFVTESVASTSINTIVYVVLGWVGVNLLNDYRVRVTDMDNPNVGQLVRAKSATKLIPWVIVVLIAAALKIGVANMFTHLMWLSSFQITGILFGGFEMKYDILIKRGVKQDVSMDT